MTEKKSIFVILALVGALAIPAAAFAAGKGQGKANGNNREAAASCIVDGNLVHASGLPEDLLNFMIADADGETGWVLGHTYAGTWTVAVPDRTSETTYKFVSRTKGKDGKQYTTFAACSAGG